MTANDSLADLTTHFPSWLHGTVYFVIGFVAVGGNIINIIVLPKLTNYPESAKTFMTILAMNDLGTGTVLLAVSPCTWQNEWLWGNGLCKVLGFFFFFFGGGGSTLLLLMNIDRYFAISKPFLHQRYMSNRNVCLLCGCVLFLWFIFIQLCMTIETFLDNVTYSAVYRLCITQLQNLQGVYPFLLSFCLYFQSIILIIIYMKIWRTSRQHSRRIHAGIPSSTNAPIHDERVNESASYMQGHKERGSDTKAIRTTLLVTGFFILSYAPYSTGVVLNFLRVFIPPSLDAGIVILAVCNTWWNTVVYSVYNRSFREKLKRMCKRYSASVS